MKILTHPDNLDLVRKYVDDNTFGAGDCWYGIEIVTDRLMDKQKKTGRYILPDGRRLARHEFVLADGKFFEWGNSDLELKYLLGQGIIREEMEPLYYLIRDDILTKYMYESLEISSPKHFISTIGVT